MGINLKKFNIFWNHILFILPIFLPIVRLEIDIITAKPYIPSKSLLQLFFHIFLCCNIGMIIYDLHGYGGC